jgi:hypothetical protein
MPGSPEADLGVHLTLNNEWIHIMETREPIVKLSLVDNEGFFLRDKGLEKIRSAGNRKEIGHKLTLH